MLCADYRPGERLTVLFLRQLCGAGHLRTARAVITLPASARTVPTRGPIIPFYDVAVVHDPLPTKFSLPLNFDVISDVTPANSARTFHEEPNVTTIEFRVWVKSSYFCQ